MIVEGVPLSYRTVRLCGCSLRKSKRASPTAVGRYVDRKAPALTRRIARALRAHASDIAPRVAKRYAALTKGDDDIVRRLTELLDAEGLGGELESQMAYALRRAFKAQALTGLQQVGLTASEDMTSQMDQAAKDYAETRGGELIKDLAGTTIDDMRALFGRAIEEGMSADDLEQAVLDAGAFGPARAEMIARTELAFAHMQGNVAGWRQSDQVEKKRWILGDNHDIDDECDEAVDAGEVDFEDEFIDGIDWPPAHPNAVLAGHSFASYGQLVQMVSAPYNGPAIRLVAQRLGSADAADRIELTIGPNHPMLTQRGFVRAKDMLKGDELIHDAAADHTRIAAVEANLQQVMRLEDAFQALRARGGNARIAAAASYFHGDQVFLYGEVDVVRPDHDLLPILDPGGIEQLCQHVLVGPDPYAKPFLRQSTLGADLWAVDLPAAGDVRWCDMSQPLLNAVGGVPRFERYRVVSCHGVTFTGLAFDASTATRLYSCHGFVVRNCICDVVPILRESADTEE